MSSGERLLIEPQGKGGSAGLDRLRSQRLQSSADFTRAIATDIFGLQVAAPASAQRHRRQPERIDDVGLACVVLVYEQRERRLQEDLNTET